MINIMQISHYFKSIFPWFYPSQAVQDFFRQQYDSVSKQGMSQNGQWFPCFILWTWVHITSLKRRAHTFANHTYVPGICTGFIRGVFPKSRMKVHFGLWAKSHLLMSMDHTANEEASTSNDRMNIGRGMERWRMLVSIPFMKDFLPQCGFPEKTPPSIEMWVLLFKEKGGGVFIREGLETCCLVSLYRKHRCSDKGWSAGGHAVKGSVFFFFGDASGGRQVYLAHINDICKGANILQPLLGTDFPVSQLPNSGDNRWTWDRAMILFWD